MIEIAIPQDIRAYEPTLIGFLTTRQVLSGGIGLAAAFVISNIEKTVFGIQDPLNVPIFLIPLIPAALIGWVKLYGLTFEKYISQVFIDNFINPTKRKYQIDNLYDVMYEESKYDGMSAEEIKEFKKQELKLEKARRRATKKEPNRSTLPQELRPYK